ncbi:MAG: SDR family NAD(P)-dependent oxidoreductase [Pseudooceanicola sp.]
MSDDILNLGGRPAMITGAGQGVGRQIALHLARHGCPGVVVNDFHLDRAEAVAEEVREAGGTAMPYQCDVTNLEAVREMTAKAAEIFGPVGILVNNAGNIGATPTENARDPFWTTGPEDWNSFIGVNFYGVINATSAVIPGMIERQAPGRIITIISEAAHFGDSGLEIYAGAKAGAAGFMRGCARTLGRHGITANCIAIAFTATPDVRKRYEADPERLKKMMSRYIVRRPGEPKDIANMALFLASDASEWITGQTYSVSGGFHLGI